MNITKVGDGKVKLIAGGGKVFTDIAARFVGSDRSLDEIVASPYNKDIVKNIIDMGHLAMTEFDYYIFAVEGYSRVTEAQLLRKRVGANYSIKSGRGNKEGNRSFDVVIPPRLHECTIDYNLDGVDCRLDVMDILDILEKFYNAGCSVNQIPEEDMRYIKPQATEFKGLIGMNARALLDWFKVRLCLNAQFEIRDMALKMLAICKKVSPDIFQNAGASCVVNGFCTEGMRRNESCLVPTLNELNLAASYLNLK